MMIPYYPEPVLHIGPIAIAAFHLLMTAGVLLGGYIMVTRACRFKMSGHMMFQASQWAIVFGLVGAHVAKLAMDFHPLFAANPWIVFTEGRGIRSIGGLAGGLLGALLCCRAWWRASWFETFRLLDVMAFSMPFAFTFGRLGCFLAHDHRGLPSIAWIAVRFSEGPRYDLGLIEFLFLIGMSVMFWLLDRGRGADTRVCRAETRLGARRPAGFFLGLYGVGYGAFRIWLDTLHIQPMRFYEGAALCVMGVAAWMVCFRRAATPAGAADPLTAVPSASPAPR